MQKRSCAKTKLCKNEVYTKTSFWYATQRNATHQLCLNQNLNQVLLRYYRTVPKTTFLVQLRFKPKFKPSFV
ncbi:hypothetical protein EON70_00360 [bacterium]|nr:MAG: hypothetical protein EON70_00360 [bacterium]